MPRAPPLDPTAGVRKILDPLGGKGTAARAKEEDFSVRSSRGLYAVPFVPGDVRHAVARQPQGTGRAVGPKRAPDAGMRHFQRGGVLLCISPAAGGDESILDPRPPCRLLLDRQMGGKAEAHGSGEAM